MRRIGFFAVLLALGYNFGFAQEVKKEDPLSHLTSLKPWEVPYVPIRINDTIGQVDTLYLEMQKGAKDGEWVLHFSISNDEPLFAFSFPIRHDSLLSFDSVSLAGTRTDFFQTKMVNKPNTPNTVTVGLFSALNPEAPPVEPGRGLVMKMYFKAPAARPVSIRSAAPIHMPPGLEFVTPQGLPIHPAVVRIGDSGAEAPAKKPAKPASSSKEKKKG
ncbi:MAG: hypothetical protein L0Z48_05525 [candidate division Zixibacteria bacterium]|nr:hypothetical protein [candidate division Zixibacteria bacterium]MCI0595985.1 hypothetical protein [candidate division Zixibacteria bacterium]